MEKMVRAFGHWRLNEPPTRHKLLVNSSHRYAHENALFMILAWDYVLNPTDRKITGLRDLFIRAKGDLFVNIPGPMRSKSSALKNV